MLESKQDAPPKTTWPSVAQAFVRGVSKTLTIQFVKEIRAVLAPDADRDFHAVVPLLVPRTSYNGFQKDERKQP